MPWTFDRVVKEPRKWRDPPKKDERQLSGLQAQIGVALSVSLLVIALGANKRLARKINP